jgi:uncharacterized damage-inducible protein DinB
MPHDRVIESEALRRHWQGHRRLTRRVVDAFPEDALFGFSVGGMRPFADLAREMIRLADGGMRGLATGDWSVEAPEAEGKAGLLASWDHTTATIDRFWPQLAPGWPDSTYAAFGQWEGPGHAHVLYWIDNEVHHRGQGYVYLRALGIEPPAFYERG